MARTPRSTTRIGGIVVAAVAVLTLTGCPSNGGGGDDGGGGYGLGPTVSVVVDAPAGATGT